MATGMVYTLQGQESAWVKNEQPRRTIRMPKKSGAGEQARARRRWRCLRRRACPWQEQNKSQDRGQCSWQP